MTEIANFKKQQLGGSDVATIKEDDSTILEVMRRHDGNYELTVHNRRGDSDRWDDCSVTLKPAHFAVLGSIAAMGADCTCAAPDEGKWANKHTADCASLGA